MRIAFHSIFCTPLYPFWCKGDRLICTKVVQTYLSPLHQLLGELVDDALYLGELGGLEFLIARFNC